MIHAKLLVISGDDSHSSDEERCGGVFKLLRVHRGTVLQLRARMNLRHGLRHFGRRDFGTGLQIPRHVGAVRRLQRLAEGGEHRLAQRPLGGTVRSAGHRRVQTLGLTDVVGEHGAGQDALPEELEGHGLVVVALDAAQERSGGGAREPAFTAQTPQHLRVQTPAHTATAAHTTRDALRQQLIRHTDVVVKC